MAVRSLSPVAQRQRKEPGGRQWRRRNESRSSWVILSARLLSVLPIRPLRVCAHGSCATRPPSRGPFKAPSQRRYFHTSAYSLLPLPTPPSIPLFQNARCHFPAFHAQARENHLVAGAHECTHADLICLRLALKLSDTSPALSRSCEFVCICASYIHKHVFVVWIFLTVPDPRVSPCVLLTTFTDSLPCIHEVVGYTYSILTRRGGSLAPFYFAT